jgi:intracellular septation protein
MKLFFDFFPVLLFFISFKLYGIYVATGIAIVASFLQVALFWLIHRRFDKMHVITLLLILVLGGATLIFRNPVFIKWKPTGIYWVTALVFLVSRYVSHKPLIEKMMENNIQLNKTVWRRLNMAWVFFFIMMGFFNIYIAYNYDTNTWVNFKFFGGLGLTMVFVLIQSFYLARHIGQDNSTTHKNG